MLDAIVQLLKSNSLLLMFLVIGVGFALGQIKFWGVQLGVAMVLFVGIAVGSLDSGLKLPDLIFYLGLALFVYTLGLSAAPSFFRALNREGLRQSGLVVASLVASFFAVWGLANVFGLSRGIAATLYGGSLTNAPTLAGVVDALRNQGVSEQQLGQIVVGYAISYPPGILIPLILIVLYRKISGVDLREEAKSIPSFKLNSETIQVFSVRVTNKEVCQTTVSEMAQKFGNGFTFGRLKRGDQTDIVNGKSTFQLGDLVSVIGAKSVVENLIEYLGEVTNEHLEYDRQDLDLRRVFVSNSNIAGRTLKDIQITRKFNAVVTRVKRDEMEFIPTGDTVLQLGDRVRILAHRADHPEIAKFLGDRNRTLNESDLLALCVGVLLGLLIGEIPIPMPQGATFKLGFAGGPLVVALFLGRIQRTGPLIWNIPHTANLTLRQFGLAIFAAGVGLRSGYQFVHTLQSGLGGPILIVGAVSSLVCGLVVLVGGHKIMKIPLNTVLGMYAAAQTQPVTLSFVTQQTGNSLPATAYAMSSPFATIFKIFAASLLLSVLR
jgi:putative transport protein